jgi:hypothetical protein
MPTNAQLSSHIWRQKLSSRCKPQIHTLMSRYGQATCRCLLSSWYEQAHAGTCKGWDTCIHMQAFNTCMYMHGFNACRCIQSHTLDECRMIHVKHERAYMDGWRLRGQIWMKHSSALMLHMTMIQICWHADLPSMYLVCRSLYNGRLCIKKKETLPLTRRGLRSSLEIIRGPAERSRIMKRQLKAQEDTSLKNIRRSVHELFARKFEHEN